MDKAEFCYAYTPFESDVREWLHGAWFVSSIFLLCVLLGYVGRERGSWRENPGVAMAAALIILMIGHAMRAGTLWAVFFEHGAGVPAGWWQHWSVVAISLVITILGKIACTYSLMPPFARTVSVAGLLFVSAAIPTAVLLLY